MDERLERVLDGQRRHLAEQALLEG